jgi:hypothetical protein
MKKYIMILLAVSFTFEMEEINAQIKSEYIIGLNFATMTLKSDGLAANPKMLVGIHFGQLIEIPLNDNFAFQPGLLLSSKGSKYIIDSTDFSISPIFIEIPVNALVSFGSDLIKISLFAGPYFAFGIGGYRIDPAGNFKYLRYGSGGTYDLKHFDIGLNFGIGLNFKGLLISAQYGKGFSNLSPLASSESEMKNKVVGVSISSSFTGRQY